MQSAQSPNLADIARLNQEVETFVDQCVKDHPCARWFGDDYTPFRFELAHMEKDRVVLNHIRLQYPWDGHGVFTNLIRYLSSQNNIREIGVKSAGTPEVQKRLRKLHFIEYEDQDFILKPKENRLIASAGRFIKKIKRLLSG